MSNEDYPIGEVARLAGVSIRTLHHYDDIGLVRPSGRTTSGHRRYSATDLGRLRQVLVYRELDFGLDQIAQMLADPGATTDTHLRAQHRLLRCRIDRDQRLLRTLDKEMEARTMGMALTPQEQFEVFGTDQVGGEWADEAQQRWGGTEAWRESQRRAATYTKQDWIEIKEESDAITRAYADAMLAGVPATDERAMEVAERARLFIDRRFNPCDHELHRSMAQLYLTDERFRATYDAVQPGLAQYVHDAIVANAARERR